MDASTPQPTSFAGQIIVLISAVEESDRQISALAERNKKLFANKKKNIQKWQDERHLQHKNEIIEYLRSNPGSQTTEISKHFGGERSTIFRRLRRLEYDGVVYCVAKGNIFRWTLI